MNRGCLSIYFYVFKIAFLSTMFPFSSVHKSCTFLVKFIYEHFILIYNIINGIIFFILISDYSLLVCRNTMDFCKLIVYLPTVLNLFTRPDSVCVYFLKMFFMLRSCYLWIEIVISVIPIKMSFLFLN